MFSLEAIGLILQIFGLLVIFGSQIWSWYRVRKKYGSIEEALVVLTIPKEGLGERLDHKLGKKTNKQLLESFPLAKFLYDDIVISVIGVIFALIGTVFELVGM